MFTWTFLRDGLPSLPAGFPSAVRSSDRLRREVLYQIAMPKSGPCFTFALSLRWIGADGCPAPPDLHVKLLHADPQPPALPSCTLTWTARRPGEFRYLCRVETEAADDHAGSDEEFVFLISCEHLTLPACRVVVRRTLCTINTAVLEHGAGDSLHPQMRAALLWQGWRRYREIVALKAFTSGKSGSDVLVVQPGLLPSSAPRAESDAAVSMRICTQSWGSCLLVKTGPADKVFREWDQFHTFLADRLHPFMTRSEALLCAQPGQSEGGCNGRHADATCATLLSSFLGGSRVQVESLEALARGPTGVDRCLQVLERLFLVSEDWYRSSEIGTLADWHKVFHPQPPAAGGAAGTAAPAWRFLGEYDFRSEDDRHRFAEGLYWDVDYVREEHLSRHLLGRPPRFEDGLLPKLMRLPLRFSLIHGDLHPRNVLVDGSNVWLIDFGKTGIGPTLADFATLEVFLRLWCLELSPEAKSPDWAGAELERLLLDGMVVGEINAEEVRALAEPLGAQPNNLSQVTACISWVRRRAAAYGLGRPDRQDYLAVLFLILLETLRYARNERDRASNYRLLMALFWLVEDVLNRMVGLESLERQRLPFFRRHLLSPQWLEAPAAPARVRYFFQREDGCRALPAVAATRGVLQNANHHLDVFDHTLLALANLEAMLDEPLAAFLDPAAFEKRVRHSLHQQGLPAAEFYLHQETPGTPDHRAVQPYLPEIERQLTAVLNRPARLMLKWSILLHDVGKPATRSLSRKGRPHFLGHELYGLQLLDDQLDRLFPDGSMAAERELLCRLILRHHEHHKLFHYFLGGDRLASLRQALETGGVHTKEMKGLLDDHLAREGAGAAGDFPLLILHGFADFAASRGGHKQHSLARVAEVNLILLAAWAHRAYLCRRRRVVQEAKQRCDEEFRALNLPEPCRSAFSRSFRARYVHEANGESLATTPLVSPEAAQVRRLAMQVVGELVQQGLVSPTR